MTTPTEANVREALARVCASDEFAASPRLMGFLTWVVEQGFAGRASTISAKAIAAEVYGRDTTDDDTGLNLVRVEARRLRRRLDQYYGGPGQNDAWRIRIDKGGYAPRFETMREVSSGDVAPGTPRVSSASHTLAVLGLTGVSVAVFAAVLIPDRQPVPVATAPVLQTAAAERSAIGARSMISLQAVNLALQARNLLFPVFDLRQQEISLDMYRHVIELDPGLHHGYAGAAQVLAVMSLLEADADKSASFREEAHQMAISGLDRAPTDAWALGAAAWVYAVSNSPEEALEHARLAVDLSPRDGYVLDLAGMTAIVAGDGAFAAEVSDPARPRSGVARFGANNIWGVSQYMSGNYPAAIEAFAGAAEAGASISAPSLVFLAVASDHVGEAERAAAAVRELKASWPNFPLQFVMGRIFKNNTAYSDDILERIAKYGYQARL